jgi:hypothetical protein
VETSRSQLRETGAALAPLREEPLFVLQADVR